MKYLAVHVTLAKMNVFEWVYEIFGNGTGLVYHTILSNQLLEEWLDRERNMSSQISQLRRMHCISIDFATEILCQKIVMLNFS